MNLNVYVSFVVGVVCLALVYRSYLWARCMFRILDGDRIAMAHFVTLMSWEQLFILRRLLESLNKFNPEQLEHLIRLQGMMRDVGSKHVGVLGLPSLVTLAWEQLHGTPWNVIKAAVETRQMHLLEGAWSRLSADIRMAGRKNVVAGASVWDIIREILPEMRRRGEATCSIARALADEGLAGPLTEMYLKLEHVPNEILGRMETFFDRQNIDFASHDRLATYIALGRWERIEDIAKKPGLYDKDRGPWLTALRHAPTNVANA